MGRAFFNFLKVFVPFAIILFAVQFFIISNFIKAPLYYSTVSNYTFHILATLIAYGVLVLVSRNFTDKTGFAFMGLGLLKMIAAIVFLLPALLAKGTPAFAQVIAFFVPYFLFLIVETIFAVKLINQNK